jgi:hypothetical protein
MPKPYWTIRRLRCSRKSQEKVKYAICIICVSLTNFPEPPTVLASIFYHFKLDSDFAIKCSNKHIPLKRLRKHKNCQLYDAQSNNRGLTFVKFPTFVNLPSDLVPLFMVSKEISRLIDFNPKQQQSNLPMLNITYSIVNVYAVFTQQF